MDSFSLFEQIEKGEVEVPPQAKQKLLQLLLATCVPHNGHWSGIPVFIALNLLSDLIQADVIHAKDALNEPEKSLAIRSSIIILFTIKKIRRDLRDTLDNPAA